VPLIKITALPAMAFVIFIFNNDTPATFSVLRQSMVKTVAEGTLKPFVLSLSKLT